MSVIIFADRLRQIVRGICVAAGSETAEADAVADNLVMANLMGHDSHGVGMLPRYIGCVQLGSLKPNTHASVVVDSGALVVVDGQAGYGQVIGAEAMDIGIGRAREHGVCVVAVRNSFHLCRIGAWAEQCAKAGFVSMHHTNVLGHSPIVAPYAAREARYATNPYTVGLPATESSPMTVLDMATSVVALGKVRVAKNKGEQVDAGALLDADGEPSTDPSVMYQDPRGAVLPFGGHKGGGLAVINELLAGVLTGGGGMRPETTPSVEAIINNMLSVIIDPGRLVEAGEFDNELDAIVQWIKSAQPLSPESPVQIPGEPEQLTRRHREANGIPIDTVTWAEIVIAGKSVGLRADDLSPKAPLG